MPTPRLTIELVPSTCFCKNVRSQVDPARWDRIRMAVYAAAGSKCEICGGRGTAHPVECHEVWEYDEVNYIQKLVRLIALCPACHEVKHFGLAQINGRATEALTHLCQVNGWSRDKARQHAIDAFKEWEDRSRHKWALDLSYLGEMKL